MLHVYTAKFSFLLLLYVTIDPVTISHVSVLYITKLPNYHKSQLKYFLFHHNSSA